MAASQTARDAVAVSRTEFHAPRFAKNCTNPFKDNTPVDDKEEDDDALMYKNFSHILWTNIYTLTLYIEER